ncbi:MAG: hypothetical protein H8E71_01650 [Candidatus Marinimicrobia bacterium]|nr:hypothetical protein [Candidatus Neomarinimicrobiota bacterium]
MGVDKVEFLIDGQVIATDTEEPWEYLWQVSYYADDATHSILAKATDEAENIGQSDLVRVFVSENAEETPTPFSPANGEILADTNIVALIWSILAGGEEYIVLVSSNPEFTDTEYSITTSDTTVTTDALADGYHYWKVRAKNSVGNYGEWSNYFTFEITGPESPTLLSPDNGEVIADAEIAELVWSTSEFAVAYDVIVSSSYNFTDTEYSITTSDTTVTTDALSDGMHYWKVRAKNSVGNYGEWSNYFTFEITGPESPTLLSPDNGEVIADAEIAELVWSTSEFAVAYDVIVSSSYNFTDTEYSITTSDTTVTTDALIVGQHYWKVRAKNSVGNYGEWSDVSSFIFVNWIIGEMTDQDGNTYQTIQIGTQVWMSENLKVTHYRDGTAIPTGHSNSEWNNLSTGAYCAYDNNESNADTYGYLYNWYAVNDSRNIAPEGWHVPTDDEWTILTDYLGGSSVAGGKMKETGTEHWNSPNTGATNESGFTALPGGYRQYNGNYNYSYPMGNYGYFWSSTESSSSSARGRELNYNNSAVNRHNYPKRSGFSVRCLMD